MRTDPFEPRARELCAASGGDPDERVARLDGVKLWPAWCAYRDARTEGVGRATYKIELADKEAA